MKSATRTIALLLLALAAGCAGVTDAPTPVMEPVAVGEPAPLVPQPPAPTPPASTSKPLSAALAHPAKGPSEPAVSAGAPTAVAPPVAVQSAVKVPPQPAKTAGAVTPSPSESPDHNADPKLIAKTAEPPLDLAALKGRLRDTKAIGVLTKLALKNQVDDLLQLFRQHYQSGATTSVAALREPYNLLVLKVLSLVQDSDPSLARTIAESREAIWGILSDRDKFNSAA